MNYYFALFSVLAAMLGATSWTLIIVGAVIVVALNMIFMRWALKQLRVEPSEELEANPGASNAIGDAPIRTSVGVPRNRSLRPRDPAAERADADSTPETVTARKDEAESEAAKQGSLASFEPLIPFSPGAKAGTPAGANPAAALSKPAESQPADSLIALDPVMVPAAVVTPVPVGALTLPPLQAEEFKSVATKAADNFFTAETVVPISSPIRAKSAASADLILVDKKSDTKDALPQAPAPLPVSVEPPPPPQPEAESASALILLPELVPLDIDQDDVKKSKSRSAATTSPEGALTASVSPVKPPKAPESTPSPLSAEMTGLILPALVPAPEPEKKTVEEPPRVSEAPEPSADLLPLPPLEPAATVKAEMPVTPEAPAKPAARQRVFLPADIPAVEKATPPVDAVVTPKPEVAPVPAAVIEPAAITPALSEVVGKPDEKPAEKAPEPVSSTAPLTALDAPAEVSRPVSVEPHFEKPEKLAAATPQAPLEQSEPVTPSTKAIASKEILPISLPEKEASALSAEVVAPAPAPLIVAEEPEKIEEPPPVAAASSGLIALAEDTGHLTAKKPEPEPDVIPSSEPAKPHDEYKDEPVSGLNEPETAVSVADTVRPDESEAPVPVAATEHHDTSAEEKPVESEPVVSIPNPGLSPVDAYHVHGAAVEPEPAPAVADDSPHDLPIQLAPAEVTPQLSTPEVVHHEPVSSTTHNDPVPVETQSTAPEFSHTPEPAQSGLVLMQGKPEAHTPISEITTTTPPQAAVAPAESAPITTPRSNMTSTESTPSTPASGRASAQLTLGFEVTSLQLTPFFKLGAVQLRPLSNIVSLHLLTTQQAENPLAAGISFQIETVDLDESAHIRSILLKPLPQSQPAAVPQPKLQVDNVQLGQTTEGAPIQVTSSQGTSTAVQLLATCTIAAMDFTPAFEIGSLRLEPNSNFVLLRSAPSQRPAALDLPPSFEVAAVQLEGNAQISSVRLTPSTAK